MRAEGAAAGRTAEGVDRPEDTLVGENLAAGGSLSRFFLNSSSFSTNSATEKSLTAPSGGHIYGSANAMRYEFRDWVADYISNSLRESFGLPMV